MTPQRPPFAPEPIRRPWSFIPFPILGPGCCGCGFVATAVLAVASIGGGLALHDGAPEAAAGTGAGSAIVQEVDGR